MPDFKKNFRSGNDRRSFSGGQSFGQRGRSFEKKELYDVECNKCHKPTQVPFRPNGKKPVYCKECFVPDTDAQRSSRFERRPSAPRSEPLVMPKDSRIDEILRRLDSMERTLEKLSSTLEASNRKEALAEEVKKHLPPEEAPVKRKKAAKKIAA
ncbi:MAG: CxxC-x17-CxxC domain-containing protein [Bacillota bacterium]